VKSRLKRVTRSQWLLTGGLAFLLALTALTPNPGTPWQSVSGLAFSPDGTKIAMGVYSGRFRREASLWFLADVDHTAVLATLRDGRPPTILRREGESGIVNLLPEVLIGPSVAFSSDGAVLASVGLDGAFDLWDVATGRLKETRSTQLYGLRTLAAAPSGNVMLTAFRYWVRLWDLDTRSAPASLETWMNIQSVAFSRDGAKLALGALGRFDLEIWDVRTRKRISKFERPDDGTDNIRSLAFTPDGKTLVAATDQTVRFLDARTGKTAAEIPERLVLSLAISPDGRWLATGRYDGVTLWDLQNGIKSTSRWRVAAAESVQLSPDGRFLAAGSSDGSIHVWNLKTGDVEWSWSFPERHFAEALMRIKLVLAVSWFAGFLYYLGQKILRPRWSFRARVEGQRRRAESWASRSSSKTKPRS